MNAAAEITRRIERSDAERGQHAAARRYIEAAACEIRIQAFREAIAIIRGNPLPSCETRQSNGRRWASKDGIDAARGRDGHG